MSICRWQQQQQWLETFASQASGMCFYFIYFTIVYFRSTQHAEMATIAVAVAAGDSRCDTSRVARHECLE